MCDVVLADGIGIFKTVKSSSNATAYTVEVKIHFILLLFKNIIALQM